MKNNLKRMLSLLLVLVMMLSAVPFASAEEQTQNAKTFTLNATSATSTEEDPFVLIERMFDTK